MKLIFKNNNLKEQKGFTLIELMVATTIFMSILLMAMGSLIVAMDGAKKAQALRVSMDNVNFAMDAMSRNIRTGTTYNCTATAKDSQLINLTDSLPAKSCPGGGDALAFRPATGSPARILYRLNGTVLEKCAADPSSSCQAIVASNVSVDTLDFFVSGNGQPAVYIKMKGSVLIKGVSTPFALQTLASQRVVE